RSARRAATLCHMKCVWGLPCNSRSGGLPGVMRWRTRSVTPPASIASSAKRSNILEDPLAEFLQRRLGQRQPKPRLLLQRQRSLGDLRGILEQFRLQRIALGIGERFDDAAGGARRDDVRVNEAIVVR